MYYGDVWRSCIQIQLFRNNGTHCFRGCRKKILEAPLRSNLLFPSHFLGSTTTLTAAKTSKFSSEVLSSSKILVFLHFPFIKTKRTRQFAFDTIRFMPIYLRIREQIGIFWIHFQSINLRQFAKHPTIPRSILSQYNWQTFRFQMFSMSQTKRRGCRNPQNWQSATS